ncbi:hypothetical protein D8S78_19490 [Natrialba swarupiae]|nr:hypothetical protein [Natrialba swarupiae]
MAGFTDPRGVRPLRAGTVSKSATKRRDVSINTGDAPVQQCRRIMIVRHGLHGRCTADSGDRTVTRTTTRRGIRNGASATLSR